MGKKRVVIPEKKPLKKVKKKVKKKVSKVKEQAQEPDYLREYETHTDQIPPPEN